MQLLPRLLLPLSGIMIPTGKDSRDATVHLRGQAQLCRSKPSEEQTVLDIKHSGLIRISLKLGTALASIVPTLRRLRQGDQEVKPNSVSKTNKR